MTFKEAKKRLDKIGKGRHRTINYEFTTHTTGNIRQQCQVYIDGHIATASTWAEAFAVLEEKLSGIARIEDVGHVPEVGK